MSFKEVWDELSDGQREAIGSKVARALTGDETRAKEVLRDVLSGILRVVLVDGVVKFFDRVGRGIPFPGMLGVVDAAKAYCFRPQRQARKVGYRAALARLQQAYGPKKRFLSVAEFRTRCLAALERVKDDEQVANLLNGQCFPFALPRMEGDLGELLDNTIVPALERSYLAQFPGRQFNNYHRRGQLAGQVTVVPGSFQQRLFAAVSAGPVCGVCFPAALQGFSVPAAREFAGRLPGRLMGLAGLEGLVVATAYPGIVARDRHTPGMDLAALQLWQSGSLSFRADDVHAYLGYSRSDAHGDCASGISVLG